MDDLEPSGPTPISTTGIDRRRCVCHSDQQVIAWSHGAQTDGEGVVRIAL